jgi:hypothetical protein
MLFDTTGVVHKQKALHVVLFGIGNELLFAK